MRADHHDFKSVLSRPCVGRPRRRVRSCHGRCASTKVMTTSSTVSPSGSSCVCADFSPRQVLRKRDWTRRRSAHGKARVQPAYCDTTTCSFVVSNQGVFECAQLATLYVTSSKVLVHELALQGRACGIGLDSTFGQPKQWERWKTTRPEFTRAAPRRFCDGRRAPTRLGCDRGTGGTAATCDKARKSPSGLGQVAERRVSPDVWNGSDNLSVHVLRPRVSADPACGSRR
jgi:hypothetical protein